MNIPDRKDFHGPATDSIGLQVECMLELDLRSVEISYSDGPLTQQSRCFVNRTAWCESQSSLHRRLDLQLGIPP